MEQITLMLGMGKGKRRLKVEGMVSYDRHTEPPPDFPFRYSMRHPDNDWSRPLTVEYFVYVNWFGYLFTRQPFTFTFDWLPVRDYEFTNRR